MSWFSHLECSAPCGAPPGDPRREHHLCGCGAPLLARYDLEAARDEARELAGVLADEAALASILRHMPELIEDQLRPERLRAA